MAVSPTESPALYHFVDREGFSIHDQHFAQEGDVAVVSPASLGSDTYKVYMQVGYRWRRMLLEDEVSKRLEGIEMELERVGRLLKRKGYEP